MQIRDTVLRSNHVYLLKRRRITPFPPLHTPFRYFHGDGMKGSGITESGRKDLNTFNVNGSLRFLNSKDVRIQSKIACGCCIQFVTAA